VVCVYLLGGNDSNNMLVPLDSPGYDAYARGRGPLALPKNSLLPVDGGSGAYGFHPSLSGLRELYNQNALAVLANVGQARLAPEHTGASQLRYLPGGFLSVGWADPTATPIAHGVTMAAPGVRALHTSHGMAQSVGGDGPVGSFPDTVFGQRLDEVARNLRSGTVHQPVFLVPLEGFDTHHNQLAKQAEVFSILDAGLTAFYRSMRDLGLMDRVTVYTDTEFNRTLAPNKTGGSLHAWGGHQMILGGSVLGGRIYGRFPSLEVGGPDDAAANGTWRPSTLDLQYAATLHAWSGRGGLENEPGYEGLRGMAQQRLDFLTA
jgi:uncharacterized protein (DUF1501 family)